MTATHTEQQRAPMIAGLAGFAYSALTYILFFATFLYAIGFVLGVPLLPKTIDTGQAEAPVVAIAINLGLLGLFAIQHSVMARPAFKRAWTRIIPKPVERTTYVLAATLCLALILWQWRPLTDPVWHVADPTARVALWALAGAGWAILLVATFLINHFELFGLQQSFDAMVGHSFTPPAFKTPGLYKLVRHPIYLGFVIGFWAAPDMSVGHLFFAAGCTSYILVGIFFEERDLIAHFGDKYRAYQRRVPMLLPFAGNRGRSGD